jgi:hypothetical protein
MAEINKPLTWATPSGTRWVNRYYEPEYGYSDYYTERGRKQHRFIADDSDETDRKRAVRSVAPNVIHGCDASHAIFTINACAAEDIEVATNHDCFSMLAPDAKRFNEIVREQFVRLHERDLLGEIRAALRRRALPNCLLFQDAASFPSVPFWEPSTSFPSHPAHHNTDGCPLGHRASMEFWNEKERRRYSNRVRVSEVARRRTWSACGRSILFEISDIAAPGRWGRRSDAGASEPRESLMPGSPAKAAAEGAGISNEQPIRVFLFGRMFASTENPMISAQGAAPVANVGS